METLKLLLLSLLIAKSKSKSPENLRVLSVSHDSVQLSWTSAREEIHQLGHELQLRSSNNIAVNYLVKRIPRFSDNVTINNLTPGASYNIQLCPISNGNKYPDACTDLKELITTKPNSPKKFSLLSSDETKIYVNWLPPVGPTIFDNYQVQISSSIDGIISRISTRGKEATFYSLVPGRMYRVSVKTVSRNQVSDSIEIQVRTVPLSPTNVTISCLPAANNNFNISWAPPKDVSDYDSYRVLLKYEVNNKLVDSNVHPIQISRIFNSFQIHADAGNHRVYWVSVETISDNVFSKPAYHTLTII